METPEQIVERQFAAYNRRDLGEWLATYSPQASQFLHDGTLLARGRDEIAGRMQERFRDPHLRAHLLHRTVIESTVADHERVTRTGTLGLETVEMLCIYVVENGAITRATFAFGPPRPTA